MYGSTTILNSIIRLQPGRGVMGYLKLVYLAQGWSIAFGRPVVADLPTLCEYGPTHMAVYEALRGSGGRPVFAPVPASGFCTASEVPEADTATMDILKQVVETYGAMTDIQLSNHCHEAGTPWRLIRDSRAWRYRAATTMREDEIGAWFRQKLAEHRTAGAEAARAETPEAKAVETRKTA